MNYLFYGKDSGKIQKEIQRVISEYKENCDVITYDLNQTKMNEVMQELTTLPFFSEHKIIIVKHCDFLSASGNDIDFSQLESFLKQPIVENTLIMIGEFEKCDARKKIVKLVNRTCRVKSFQNLDDKDKRGYVAEKCRELNIRLKQNVLSMLVDRLSVDTWEIDNQLEKLSNYPDELNEDVISSLIIKPLDENIFQLSESLLKGNFKKAFSIYKDMHSLSYDPIYFIAVLSSQFRFYYQVKVCMNQGMSEDKIASYLKAHPYRIKLTCQNLRGINIKTMMHLLDNCAKCDMDIKSGAKEKFLAFELFLLECKGEVK